MVAQEAQDAMPVQALHEARVLTGLCSYPAAPEAPRPLTHGLDGPLWVEQPLAHASGRDVHGSDLPADLRVRQRGLDLCPSERHALDEALTIVLAPPGRQGPLEMVTRHFALSVVKKRIDLFSQILQGSRLSGRDGWCRGAGDRSSWSLEPQIQVVHGCDHQEEPRLGAYSAQ